MAGIERGNVTNEEFMEEVARYECVYNRNSKNFKDKNKKASSWEKLGEKFNLTAICNPRSSAIIWKPALRRRV